MTEPTLRMAIAVLGAIAALALVGLIALAVTGTDAESTSMALVGIATAVVGGVAGVITSKSRS